MMTVLVSGGFDPLHVGHLELLDAAAARGHVLVALNTDDWLRRKKGYSVMPHADRTRILKALAVVTDVTPVNDADGTVCQTLRNLRPDCFANGGDRTQADPREHAVCEELGIEELFDIGGAKVRSSSQFMERGRAGGALFTTAVT